jgi:hypothetical protein
MPAPRRLTLALTIAAVLIAGTWVSVLPGFLSPSNALWVSLAIGVVTLVATRFRAHAELPDSVKLH